MSLFLALTYMLIHLMRMLSYPNPNPYAEMYDANVSFC